MKKTLLICFTLASAAVSSPAAVYAPISINGAFFDRDIIFGSTTPIGTVGTNSNMGQRQFYENGIEASGGGTLTGGLPANGALSVIGGADTFNFQLADDSVNNVRVFHGGVPSATATLISPLQYSSISILAAASGGDRTFNYTINYNTGAADTGTFLVPDWGVTDGAEVFNISRTTADLSTSPWNGLREAGETFSFFHREITTDSSRSIVSIAFTQATNVSGIMGISGVVIPEPSVAFLSGLGLLGLLRRRRK